MLEEVEKYKELIEEKARQKREALDWPGSLRAPPERNWRPVCSPRRSACRSSSTRAANYAA